MADSKGVNGGFAKTYGQVVLPALGAGIEERKKLFLPSLIFYMVKEQGVAISLQTGRKPPAPLRKSLISDIMS